jgi:AcrR family transcriptional regulator
MVTALPRGRRAGAPRRAGRGRGERWHAERTRQALLEAAAELFAARGFDGVPIEDVAARAGVNKALISYHFRGKRGLYVAVLAAVFSEMAARLEAIEAEPLGVREDLRRVLAAFAELRRERPYFPALFLREVLARGLDPAVLPQIVRVAGAIRGLAERGMREGAFRPVDPSAVHFALVGSLVFFFATEPARSRAAASGRIPFPMPDAEAFVAYLEELTLRGLAPAAAHPSPRTKGAHA